ncbi:hypothetical protein [Halomonas hibernica]|uniref:hypothetical protein n=1 Tax=Halomonas hibernica TaxID=2591147 RepID=UPI001556BB08|nr:hypothetical protein [Halomonas hibernica]
MKTLTRTVLATVLMATSLTAMASDKVVKVDVLTASSGYEKVEFDPREIGLSPDLDQIKLAMKVAGADDITQRGYIFEADEGEEFTINDMYTFPFDHKDYERGLEFTASIVDAEPEGEYLHYDIIYNAVSGMEDTGDSLDLNIEEHNIEHRLYIEGKTVVSFDIKDMDENNRIENRNMFVVFDIEDK